MDVCEKRACARIPVSLPARIELSCPKRNSDPVLMDVELSDLNERGCMVRMDLDDDSVASQLREGTCSGFVAFGNRSGLPERVYAKTVWVERHGGGFSRAYNVGLFFEDCPERDALSISAFLDGRSLH